MRKSLDCSEKYKRAFLVSEDDAWYEVMEILWPGGPPPCPRCLHTKAYILSESGKLKCKNCGKRFTNTSETWFRSAKVSFKKILAAIIMVREDKMKNKSEMGRRLGLSQKGAWSLISRVEDMLKWMHNDD